MADNNKLADERKLLLGRFGKSGIDDFSETEMLKMFLFSMTPRCKVSPAVQSLTEKFGSLKNVLFAPLSELEEIKDVGKIAALQLRFIGALIDYLTRPQPLVKERFASFDKAADYLIAHFKNESAEILTLLLLDNNNALLDVRDITSNRPNHITVSNREIIGQIVKYNCRKVIIAHNHPDGTAAPSGSDLKRTRELGEIFKKIGVGLVDHIIVCKDKALSLRKSGYLEDLFPKKARGKK